MSRRVKRAFVTTIKDFKRLFAITKPLPRLNSCESYLIPLLLP